MLDIYGLKLRRHFLFHGRIADRSVTLLVREIDRLRRIYRSVQELAVSDDRI
jgi:hypothetical protein